MTTYRGWAVTVRPADGLTDEMVERAVTCFKKLDGAFAVTEKLGKDRHLHAGLFFAKAVRKQQVIERMKLVQGECSPAELHVLKLGVKIMYSDDFFKKYLTKGDDTVVVYDDVPTDTDQYYPTKMEQMQAQQMWGKHDDVMELYWKRNSSLTLGRTLDFLRELWFSDRKLHAPENLGKQLNKAINLHEMLKAGMKDDV